MDIIAFEKKLKNLLRKSPETNRQEIVQNLKVTFTPSLDLGDYSTNLLFLLKKYAPEKEEIILNLIKKWEGVYFKKIEILPNGFINFYLSDLILIKNLRDLAKNIRKYFSSNKGFGRKVNIDFVSANPTGPLTLGNGRSLVLGNALAEILKLNNFKVTKEYFVNDRGNQIRTLGESIKAVIFNLPMKENYYRGDYIIEVAEKLKNKISEKDKDEDVGRKAGEIILENYIKPVINDFGVKYDVFYYESSLYKKDLPQKILKILKQKDLISEKEGALWLNLTKLGEIKDEVLIKKDGEATYFFSDILYHYEKIKIRKFKYVILIVGADHLDHVRRLKKALSILGIKESQIKPIVYQLVNIKKGESFVRMSKRKGIFITLKDLMDEIGLAPIVIYFLKTSPERHLIIELELAKKESEENPAWYLLYAYVRLNQILLKAKKLGYKERKIDYQKMAAELINKEIYRDLVREVVVIKNLFLIIANNFSVHLLGEELIKFAKLIHNFYEKERILTIPLSERKLTFVKILKDTLGFLFDIINLPKLEKM